MNAPVDYLSLQLVVILLQLVHLLQEAPQPGVQAPHGVRGVLRQVHGRLPRHIRTFSRRTPRAGTSAQSAHATQPDPARRFGEPPGTRISLSLNKNLAK